MYWYASIYSGECFWPHYMYHKMSPNNRFRWCPLGKLSHLGLEQLPFLHSSNSALLLLFWSSISAPPFLLFSYPILLLHHVLPSFSIVHSLLLQSSLIVPLISSVFDLLCLLINYDRSAHAPLWFLRSALIARTGSVCSAQLYLSLLWTF